MEKRFLTAVAAKITTDWKWLGRALEMPEPLLESIGDENSETEEKAYQTVLKWQRNLGNSNATKEVLFEALRKIGRTLEAEELEKEYGIPADVKRRPWSEVIIRCYSLPEPTKIPTCKSDSQIKESKFRERTYAFSREYPQSKIEITIPSPVIKPRKVEEEEKSSECSQSSKNKLQNSAGNCSMAPSTQLNVQEQDINPDCTNPNQPQVETPQIVIQLNLTQREILKSVHCYQKVSEDLVEKQPEDTTPYKQDGVDNDH